MTLHALFEDFALPAPPADRPPHGLDEAAPPLSEEDRLAAFEQGYAAGYEDATAAEEEARRRVGAALAARLEDLAFTYHEARVAVLREVRELVAAIGDGVLPEMGRAGFGAALAEAVAAGIEARAACPVAVSVAPGAVEVVAPLMPEVPGFPVSLRSDPDLGEGQAVIGFPDGERELDLAPVVDLARAALADWVAGAASSPEAHPAELRMAAHG